MSVKNPTHWFRKLLLAVILVGGAFALFSSNDKAPAAAAAAVQSTNVPLQWDILETIEHPTWTARFDHLTLLIEGHAHACDVYKKRIDEYAVLSGHAVGHVFAVMKLKGNPYLNVRYAKPNGNFDCTVQLLNSDKPVDQAIEQIECDVGAGGTFLPTCAGNIASQERLYTP